MSAGALLISDNEIHLMSDGTMAVKENGDWKAVHSQTNKIKVINDKCACLWLGVGLYGLWDTVKEQTEHLSDPYQIARKISDIVQPWYNEHTPDTAVKIRLAGFYKGLPRIYEVNSYDDDFTPLEEQFKPGLFYAWSMVHTTNKDMVYPSMVSNYVRQGLPTEDVAKGAFQAVIDNYQQQDVTIGGGVYHHCISL